jgi:hypothetical protein
MEERICSQAIIANRECTLRDAPASCPDFPDGAVGRGYYCFQVIVGVALD